MTPRILAQAMKIRKATGPCMGNQIPRKQESTSELPWTVQPWIPLESLVSRSSTEKQNSGLFVFILSIRHPYAQNFHHMGSFSHDLADTQYAKRR